MTKEQQASGSALGYVICICLVAALGGILFGYDTAVISGAIDSIATWFELSPTLKGWAVSSVVIGSIVGAGGARWLANVLGRRLTMQLAAVLFLVSAIGSALAFSFWFYIALRVVGGLAVGIASVVSPMYMGELAPQRWRGRTLSMFQQSLVVGQTIVFFVNYFIARDVSTQWLTELGWRWMLGSEAIPAVLFGVLLFLVPESPRWCIMNNQFDRARRVLNRFNTREQTEQLIEEVRYSLQGGQASGRRAMNQQRRNERRASRGAIRQPILLGITVLGIFISAAQQFTGINVVMYYAPTVLSGVTDSTGSALLQTGYVGLVFILGNLLGMMLIDRTGRIRLMTVGTLACIASMAVLGTVFWFDVKGYTAMLAIMVYVVGYAVSWGCCSWTLLSEIFPNTIRGTAMAWAMGAQWTAGFIVAQTFPMMRGSEWLNAAFHGAFPFWLFGLLTLGSLLITWRFVPETRNVPLESMEQLMGEKFRHGRVKNRDRFMTAGTGQA
ncbi:sugar porter family MFS transporter [Kushneria phosphatilytica]|uniref:sugar porter family MFS transporter n=1 Tax=Kushneria phosphatilytica TaxID=657387 RepID=UPI0008DA664C|nr:sugar porter family MFS transporter [Kushneria phosphatilytica]OHV12779.1 MFS transporter [Kushneria phosphatilytica]